MSGVRKQTEYRNKQAQTGRSRQSPVWPTQMFVMFGIDPATASATAGTVTVGPTRRLKRNKNQVLIV